MKSQARVAPPVAALAACCQRVKLVTVLLMVVIGMVPAALAQGQGVATTKEVIQKAQRQLLGLGYEVGSADGAMGPKTVAALKRFQSDHGLPVTSVLDQKTLDALMSAAPEPAAEKAEDSKTGASINDAAGSGDLQRVKALLKANPRLVSSRGEDGDTPLLNAAMNGRVDVVRLLLASGAQVDAAESHGLTPLLIACQGGGSDVVKLLLAAHANINATARNGATPLALASEDGDADLVKLLLTAGAKANIAASGGITALRLASERGHADVVRLLLAAHASVDAADQEGTTPLIMASQQGHTDVVKLLLANRANVNAASKSDLTPLTAASDAGHTDIVQLLKDAGATRVTRGCLQAIERPGEGMVCVQYAPDK